MDFVSLPPAERCAVILRALHARLVFKGHGSVLGQALLRVLSARVRGAADRIAALGALLAAGTLLLRPPRERPLRDRPLALAPAPAAAPAAAEPAKPRLPGGFGWLLRVAPGIVGERSQLSHLLYQPDMAALIAAAPPVAQHLRPICRMLGLKPPPGLFPPRRKPRRRPKPPEAAAAPTPRKGKPPRRAVPEPALYAAPQVLPPRPPPPRRKPDWRRPMTLFPLKRT